MISSIRTFLLANLLLSVTLSTTLAIIGNIFIEHKEFQTQLDSQLTLAAYTIQAFIDEGSSTDEIREIQDNIDQAPNFLSHVDYDIDQQIQTLNTLLNSIQFQVWDHEGELLLHSYAAPNIDQRNQKTGFNMIWLDGKPWRTFSIYNSKKAISIVVMQRHDLRINIEKQITEDSITIMIIIYPFLGLLIWLIVGKGLKSIAETTNEIKERDRNRLSPISLDQIPQEIIPLIQELNRLFERLSEAFFREKRFASDAAHELKTPLAAISAQAQVIRNAKDDHTRQQAIDKLMLSVKRSSHVIHQLLVLSRMVPESSLKEQTVFHVDTVAREIIAELVPSALQKEISIELICNDKNNTMRGSKTAMGILIRNLVDNAIKYTPEHGTVEVHIFKETQHIIVQVDDNGPGIPEKLQHRIFERFFRIMGNKATGSGLGLSIVRQIIQIHNGEINIQNRTDITQGLRVIARFKRAL